MADKRLAAGTDSGWRFPNRYPSPSLSTGEGGGEDKANLEPRAEGFGLREVTKSMDQIKVTVDSIEVTIPKGSTVLDAAKAAGIYVPTLCFMEGHKPLGACRVCLLNRTDRKEPNPKSY